MQFGGQTPLNLANGLEEAGVPIIGTSPKTIEIAEDRKLFGAMLDKLGIRQTTGGTATDRRRSRGHRAAHWLSGARAPVLRARRPRHAARLQRTTGICAPLHAATAVRGLAASAPVLVDHFLEDATEVDVDCISDGETVVIGAIMEHIEQAGIHSGDSACVIPPFASAKQMKAEIADATKEMAKELNVSGLMNVQFAVKDDVLYVLEVNPRASRTAPFVSKADRRSAAETRREDHGRRETQGLEWNSR